MAEKEYIEREAAINRLKKVCVTDDVYGMGVQFGVSHAIAVLNEAPTADVVEVVHGAWVSLEPCIGLFECSLCGHKILKAECNYCPNCGAKMDGNDGEGK